MSISIFAFISIAAAIYFVRRTKFSLIVLIQLIVSAAYISIYNQFFDYGGWGYFIALAYFNFAAGMASTFVYYKRPAYLCFYIPMVYNMLVGVEWLFNGKISSQDFHSIFTAAEWLLTDSYYTIMTAIIVSQLTVSGMIKKDGGNISNISSNNSVSDSSRGSKTTFHAKH